MPHVDRTVFQFSFCNSPEHAMPLSHRCCISSSSVFVAPLSVEVIRANCNLKHAVTVWHLLAHSVGGIFSLQPCFRTLPDHDGIMTGFGFWWRDYDAIATRFGLQWRDCSLRIPRFNISLCVLLPRSFMGASLVSLVIEHAVRMTKYVIKIWVRAFVRANTCKCVQMREWPWLIRWLERRIYLLEVPRAREENMAYGKCALFAYHPSNK